MCYWGTCWSAGGFKQSEVVIAWRGWWDKLSIHTLTIPRNSKTLWQISYDWIKLQFHECHINFNSSTGGNGHSHTQSETRLFVVLMLDLIKAHYCGLSVLDPSRIWASRYETDSLLVPPNSPGRNETIICRDTNTCSVRYVNGNIP